MYAPPLDRHFVLRKVHSLLGIVPIGAFLCFHLFENSLAVRGGEFFYEHVVKTIDEMPYVQLMEIFAIALPILFHAVYGVIIWVQGRSNVSSYGYFRNWMYLWHRITGGIALAFILYHVWATRGQVLLGHVEKVDLFQHLGTALDSPLILAVYIVGILAAVFHLANGVWLALITWGITIGPRSQRISSWVCGLLGLLLLLFAFQALRGFTATVVA